ncbi:MAG: HEAT repeat domain-containing protein [Acidobacteriota bacterium]|nr:HEAT repeat domain-containing protein [Acidobacteriota bacterium]
MLGDDATLPERSREALVRAAFADDDATAGLIERELRAADPRARVLALRAGARRGLLGAPEWIAAVADDDRGVRREALTLFAHDGPDDDALTEAVAGALGDPDALVVDAAAFALGERRVMSAVGALVQVATGHPDARCREAAVAALGYLGDDRGRAAILAALEDKAPVRRRAIVALANFEGPDVAAALERAREDRDWQVRAAVDQLDDAGEGEGEEL